MIASATIRVECVFLPTIGHRKEAPEQTAVELILRAFRLWVVAEAANSQA
jgi:hypothetical protein